LSALATARHSFRQRPPKPNPHSKPTRPG
jgi:hypothetical protein